jgi:hypothetical protein
MLKKTCLLLSILLFACGAAFGQKTKPTQKTADKKTRNVVDFLMLLPKNYVGNYTVATTSRIIIFSNTTERSL